MKNWLLLFILTLSLAHSELVLSGVVIDNKSKDPIPLVNIYDSVSERGIVTDDSGRFSIELDDQNIAELMFSHIAFDNYYQVFDNNQLLSHILYVENKCLIV